MKKPVKMSMTLDDLPCVKAFLDDVLQRALAFEKGSVTTQEIITGLETERDALRERILILEAEVEDLEDKRSERRNYDE